jgi:hypothetical protein
MKMAISAALGAALSLAAGTAAAQEAGLAARADACIAGHAAEVARAEANLASAVDLLVNDLCAPEIELAQRYEASTRVLGLLQGQQKSMMEKMAAAPAPTPAAGHPAPGAPSPQVAPAMASMQAQHNQAQEAKMAELEKARVSPETGEIVGLPASQAGMFSLVSLVFEQLQHNHSPPRYRAAAARAMLAARGR